MTDIDNNIKQCNKCNEFKNKSEFSPDKRSTDGCQPSCKKCMSARKKENYHKNKEHYNKRQREYYKNNKEKVIEINNRSKLKNKEKILAGKKAWYEKVKNNPEWKEKYRLYRLENKEKKRIYDIQYREKNPNKCTERAKKWAKNNKEKRKIICFNYDARRRAIEKNGDSFSIVKEWADKQNKICYWCGIKCDDKFHIDHYEPLSKGGTHTVDNLVISCPKCNVRKNAKDPYLFANQVGRLF